jgi:hypothetical protein
LFGRLRRIYSIGKDESDIMCQFPEFIKSTDNVAWKSSRHFYDGSDNLRRGRSYPGCLITRLSTRIMPKPGKFIHARSVYA